LWSGSGLVWLGSSDLRASSDRSRWTEEEGQLLDQVVGVENRVFAVSDQEVRAHRGLPVRVVETANTEIPYSIARVAVINAPPVAAASITITARHRPAMIRFRRASLDLEYPDHRPARSK
jgi:hypothetical protein